MREQDILERIKTSAEDIEIPEALMPGANHHSTL